MKNNEVAQEITQDTLTKAWTTYDQNQNGPIEAWLFTVARNASYDYLRKFKKVKNSSDDLIENIPDVSLIADELIAEKQKSNQVIKLLEELTDIQKEVLHLKFVEELSYNEISQVTGMTSNHIAVFVHNVIKKLQSRAEKQKGL